MVRLGEFWRGKQVVAVDAMAGILAGLLVARRLADLAASLGVDSKAYAPSAQLGGVNPHRAVCGVEADEVHTWPPVALAIAARALAAASWCGEGSNGAP